MGAFAEFLKPAGLVTRIITNSYPRKGPRRVVEQRIADVARDKSVEALAARRELEAARAALAKKVANDNQRLASIQDAETLYENALQLLAGVVPVSSASVSPLPPPTKLSQTDQARRTELLRELDALDERITKANTTTSGNVAVLPTDHSLETIVLQGRSLGIRRKLNGALDGTELAETDTTDLAVLRVATDKLEEFVANTRLRVLELNKLRNDGAMALETLAKEQTGDIEQAKLAKLLAEAKAVAESSLISASGVERLIGALTQEIKEVEADPAKYAKQVATDVEASQRLDEAIVMLESVTASKLATLRELAEPLGSGRYAIQVQEVQKFRAGLPELLAKDAQSIPGMIGALGKAILEEIASLQETAESTLAGIEDTRKMLDLLANPTTGSLKDTRSNPAFAADWKMIDATLQTIADLMPKGGELTGDVLADLVAAKGLIALTRERTAGIAGQTTASSFGTDLAALENDIKANTKTKTPLATYNQAAVDKLAEDFKQFKAVQSVTPAAEGLKTLAALRKRFDDAKKEADDLKLYIDGITNDYETFKTYGEAATQAVGSEELSCFKPVLAALASKLEATPAVRKEIEAAFLAAQTAFTGIGSPDEAKNKALGEKPELERKQIETAETFETLKQRAKVLEERLKGVPRDLVKSVSGDENSIDAIARMLAQARQEFKVPDPKVAAKTLDRVEQRIDLVYADPTGGLARKRKELPAIQEEWTAARKFVQTSLASLLEKFGAYATEVKEDPNVRKLADRVSGYIEIFAGGEDPLKKPIAILANPNAVDARLRDAREEALAAIADLQRKLQAHPLSGALASAPLPEARAVPRRMLDKLDWLKYTIMTSVK